MIPNVLWRVEFLVVAIGQLLSSALLPYPSVGGGEAVPEWPTKLTAVP